MISIRYTKKTVQNFEAVHWNRIDYAFSFDPADPFYDASHPRWTDPRSYYGPLWDRDNCYKIWQPGHTSYVRETKFHFPKADVITGFFYVKSFSALERPALVDKLEISTVNKRKPPVAPKPPRLTCVPPFRYSEPKLRLLNLSDLPPIPVPKAFKNIDLSSVLAPTKEYSKLMKRYVDWQNTTLVLKIERQRRFVEKVNLHRLGKFSKAMKDFELRKRRYADLVRSIEDKNEIAKIRYQRLYRLYDNALKKYQLFKDTQVVRNYRGLTGLPFNQYTKFYAYTKDGRPLNHGWHDSWPDENRDSWGWRNYATPATDLALKSKVQSDPADRYRAVLEPHISSIQAKLVERYYSRLGDQRVHIGNMLVEQKQTLQMLTSIYTAIVKLVMAKKSVFKLVGRALTDPKFIADQTLQFQFGLRPLFNDAQVLIQKMSSYEAYERLVHTKSSCKKRIVRSGPEGLEGWLTCSYTGEYSVIDETIRQANQWGLLDPSQVLWEVTPWSFVVDWLIPIGNFIASCSADQGLTWKQGCFTWKFTGNNVGSQHLMTPKEVSDVVFPGDCELYIKQRVLLLAPPGNLSMFSLKNPFTINHTIDALALLVQGLRS